MFGFVLWFGRIFRLRWLLIGDDFSLVTDIGMITILIGVVTHNLDTPIWQRHSILALGLVTVPGLGMGKVISRVIVLDGVTESVTRRRLKLEKCISEKFIDECESG